MAFGIGAIDQLRARHLQILGMATGIVPAITLGPSQKHFPWHLHLWEWQLTYLWEVERHCDHLTLSHAPWAAFKLMVQHCPSRQLGSEMHMSRVSQAPTLGTKSLEIFVEKMRTIGALEVPL